MAVTTSYSGSRRANARAAAAFAAKQKRQKVLVIGGIVLLILILAYEAPKTLKLMSGSSGASQPSSVAAPQTSVVAPTVSSTKQSAAWRAARRQPVHDPFAATATGGTEATIGSYPVPAGLHDPFAGNSQSTESVATAPKGAASSSSASHVAALPKTLVVGTPGAGRSAKTGWIVILASVPSREGRTAANAFAKRANGRGVGAVSILDSSDAKPLRGGYWVVYTGPFPTLAAVTKNASHLHAIGYGTAYIRQLVVYRKK